MTGSFLKAFILIDKQDMLKAKQVDRGGWTLLIKCLGADKVKVCCKCLFFQVYLS